MFSLKFLLTSFVIFICKWRKYQLIIALSRLLVSVVTTVFVLVMLCRRCMMKLSFLSTTSATRLFLFSHSASLTRLFLHIICKFYIASCFPSVLFDTVGLMMQWTSGLCKTCSYYPQMFCFRWSGHLVVHLERLLNAEMMTVVVYAGSIM